jgi:hypothetical protein
MRNVVRLFLFLISIVTIIDIPVIHWILRWHRLYQGKHVLLAENGILFIAVSLLIFLLED